MAEPKVRFKRDDDSSYPAWNDVILGDISTRVTRKKTNGETDRPLTIASIEGLVDQRTYFGKTIASKDMSGYFLLKNGEYAYKEDENKP
jgi:type I restriction enzyme S subunit